LFAAELGMASYQPDLLRRLLRAGKPGHLADVWFSSQRRPFSFDSTHRLIRGQIPGNKMPAIRGRMSDLHALFVQHTANETKGHRPDFPRVARAEVKPHGADDAPQTNVVLMTFLD